MRKKCEQKYDIWKIIKHSLVIEESGKMRSQKVFAHLWKTLKKMKKKAQQEMLIFRMHAVCIDNRL